MPSLLIAEDEIPMAKALSIKFEKSGFKVVLAADGNKALEELRKNTFDIMLLDIMMPEMNGFDVLEAMKQENITTPVIVSTNLSQGSDYQKAESYGVAGYIVKSNMSVAEIITYVRDRLKK